MNNNAGTSADFSQLDAACNSALVLAGDTLYIEPSATAYPGFNLYKKLVMIGPGYLLSGTNGNAGLQANPNTVTATIYIDSLATGSVFMGLTVTAYLHGGTDNIRFERCYLSVSQWTSGKIMSNMVINKCQMNGFNLATYPTENLQVTNCIFEAIGFNHTAGSNILVRNNTFYNTGVTISNAYISNNIFYSSVLTQTSSTVKNNISTTNSLPAGNGNVNSAPAASIFVGGTSKDGKFMLATASPAKGMGETINGITPDCGAFGSPDPYRLSGIPPIPSIYELTVPTSVPSTSSSMSITVSTRSNN
ncbi:MAG: hypothetical protein J7578_01840 [Chitinophagaceae bacterium]|nr:hypothetical protein [Chitinophagaceae bacterium]